MVIYAILTEFIAPSQTNGGSQDDVTLAAATSIQNIRAYKMSLDLLNTKVDETSKEQFMNLYRAEMYYSMLNWPASLGGDNSLPKHYKVFNESGTPKLQGMDSLIPYTDHEAYAARKKLEIEALFALAEDVNKKVDANKDNKVKTLQSLRRLKIVVTSPTSNNRSTVNSTSTSAKTKKKDIKTNKKQNHLQVPRQVKG